MEYFFSNSCTFSNCHKSGNSAANYAYFIPLAECENFKERKALFTSDPGNRKTCCIIIKKSDQKTINKYAVFN